MPFLTQGQTNWKFLLIVVVLAVIAGGGIWFLSDLEGEKPIIPEEELIEDIEEETADWQIYTNPVHGYSFQYPETLQLLNNENIASFDLGVPSLEEMGFIEGDVLLIERYNKHNDNVGFIIRSTGKTIEEELRIERSLREQGYETYGWDYRESKITIGEDAIEGIEFIYEFPSIEKRMAIFYTTVFEYGDNCFRFTFSYPKDIDGSKYIKAYQDIISSFSFTK